MVPLQNQLYVFGGEVSFSCGDECPLWVYDIKVRDLNFNIKRVFVAMFSPVFRVSHLVYQIFKYMIKISSVVTHDYLFRRCSVTCGGNGQAVETIRFRRVVVGIQQSCLKDTCMFTVDIKT